MSKSEQQRGWGYADQVYSQIGINFKKSIVIIENNTLTL